MATIITCTVAHFENDSLCHYRAYPVLHLSKIIASLLTASSMPNAATSGGQYTRYLNLRRVQVRRRGITLARTSNHKTSTSAGLQQPFHLALQSNISTVGRCNKEAALLCLELCKSRGDKPPTPRITTSI